VSARCRSPVCTAPMHPVPRYVRSTVFTPPTTVSFCTTRIYASVVDTAFMPARSAHRSFRKPRPFRPAGRWTSAPSVPVDRKRITARTNTRSTGVTDSPRVSCRSALKCVRPRRCLPAMPTCFRIFIASGLSIGAPVYSTGVYPTITSS